MNKEYTYMQIDNILDDMSASELADYLYMNDRNYAIDLMYSLQHEDMDFTIRNEELSQTRITDKDGNEIGV
jgi:hypothetical protein